MLSNTKRTKSNTELRTFGLTMAAFIALSFGLILPLVLDWNASAYPWILSLSFAFIALLVPALLSPVFFGWMMLGETIGRVNTYIILMVVYVLLFIPIGAVLKLLRYDPLKRRKEILLDSFRVVRDTPLDKSSLENPF
jgi:hypothetical protein